MKTLVIVPAYNEEESLKGTMDELLSMKRGFDVLVINDGSKDGTARICLENGYPLLDLPVNVGLTYGFQAGVKYAQREGYDAVLQFDADGQHMPEYISRMIQCTEETQADIVIGSRFVDDKKPFSARMIGSRVISAMIKATTGKTIADPTSGMRLFRSTVFQPFCQLGDFGPEPDSLAYLIRRGAKVSEVPVRMRDRAAGESYLNLSRSVGYMIRTCMSILFVQWFR